MPVYLEGSVMPSSSSWTVERARIGGMSSRPNRPPDDPELIEARRSLRFLRLEEHVKRVLAGEPALSDEQREHIAGHCQLEPT